MGSHKALTPLAREHLLEVQRMLFFCLEMAAYQKFRILASKLRSFEEVKEVLWISNEHIHLHCDAAGIDGSFRRDNEWGYHPAIEIKKKKEYSVEIRHIGFYPLSLLNKLLLIRKKLKRRFPYTTIYYLNIEKLEELK